MAGPESVAYTRQRILAWVIVALFALAPLWRIPATTPIGVLRYAHGPAFLLILLATGRNALTSRIPLVVVACVVYTAADVTFSWYHGAPPYILQQSYYIVTAFMLAAVLRTATAHVWRILRWVGPATIFLFVVMFWLDARTAGINPITTYREAILSGNLNLIDFTLFARVFNAGVVTHGPLIVSPARRHEVFAGLLVATYMTLYACTVVRERSLPFSIAYWASLVFMALAIPLSLSRSVQLAVGLAMLMAAARLLIVSKARGTTFAATFLTISLLMIGMATPIAGFVWNDITTNTSSYGARDAAASSAITAIGASPLLGSNPYGPNADIASGGSSHNFVLDSAVIGGVVGGLSAFAILWLFGRDWLQCFRLYLQDRTFFAPLAAALIGLTFMFTAGSGTLNLPEWLGFGLFYGAFTGARDRAKAVTKQVVPLNASRAVTTQV